MACKKTDSYTKNTTFQNVDQLFYKLKCKCKI